jgi:hypothetical protein
MKTNYIRQERGAPLSPVDPMLDAAASRCFRKLRVIPTRLVRLFIMKGVKNRVTTWRA